MSKKLPRGYRNNNPGNIRISRSRWKGKLPKPQNDDGAFEQFTKMEWGLRALIRLLRDSYILRGYDTPRKIIERYAPAVENDTLAYIKVVSSELGIDTNEKVSRDKATIQKLVQAICKHENGFLTDLPFERAWELSL